MASDPNIPGEKRPAPDYSEPAPPTSRPLQIFLLVAFLITAAAYVTDQWTAQRIQEMQVKRPNPLKRLVESQSAYLAHIKAGDDALARKQYDKAVSEYRLALQGQDQSEGHQKLGQALLKQNNPDAAFAEFREAVKINPRQIEAYGIWGQALVSQGKAGDAVSLYLGALQTNANAGVLHFNLAAALQDEQRNAEAVRRLSAAKGKTNEAAAAAAESQRLATEALEQYTQAGRLGVKSAAFWSSFGVLLNEQGKFADAEACLTRAINEDPSLSRAHSELALAQFRQGNYGDAIEHYNKVLTLIPDDPATLDSLAQIYATATNSEVLSPKMAVQLAQRACDANASQNARFMDTLARSYAADGDFLKAMSWEEKALRRAGQLGDRSLESDLQARYTLFLNHKTQ
jgi:tetratricopeptide (TPR) repeat protein